MSKKNLLRQLMEAPETALEHIDLAYVDDEKFPIKRIRKGKGFTYRLGNGALKDKKHLERIEKLSIPPAWNKVTITEVPNGHIQAVGFDDKKRKQYHYHETWAKIRN